MKTHKTAKKNETRTNIPPSLISAVMSKDMAGQFPNGEEFDQLMRYVIFTMSPEHPVYREHPLTRNEISVIEKACAEKPEWKKLLTDLRAEHDTLLRVFEESTFG